jgi:hypothetical protein
MNDEDIGKILKKQTRFGLLDFSEYPEAIATTVFRQWIGFADDDIQKIWQDYNSYVPSPRITIAVSAEPSVNAYAIPDDKVPIIALSAGALVRVRQLFMFAAHDTEIFPDAEERGAGKSKWGGAIAPRDLLRRVDLAPIDRRRNDSSYVHLIGPVPPTPARLALAIALTKAAVDFVGMHEFAHLARNHALTTAEPARLFREVSAERRISEEAAELSQLCEVDADLIGGRLSVLKFIAAERLETVWQGWASDQRNALRLWIIALMLTFMLFNGWSRTFGGGSHPHPAIRIHALLAGVLEQLSEHVQVANVIDLAQEALEAARLVWHRLGLPADRFDVFRSDISRILEATTQLVARYTDILLTKLP